MFIIFSISNPAVTPIGTGCQVFKFFVKEKRLILGLQYLLSFRNDMVCVFTVKILAEKLLVLAY